jgi:hypothetical protein
MEQTGCLQTEGGHMNSRSARQEEVERDEPEICEDVKPVFQSHLLMDLRTDGRPDHSAASARKRGRPKGSKTQKTKYERKLLVPKLIDIGEICGQHTMFSMPTKTKVDGHWNHGSQWVATEILDPSRLLWVVSTVSYFESINEDLPYAPIAAKYWHDRLGAEYPLYLRFLEFAGVIEIDHHFSNVYDVERKTKRDSKTKGYRIKEAFISAPVAHTVTLDIPKKRKEHLEFDLTDPFFHNLDIDFAGMSEYLETLIGNSISEKRKADSYSEHAISLSDKSISEKRKEHLSAEHAITLSKNSNCAVSLSGKSISEKQNEPSSSKNAVTLSGNSNCAVTRSENSISEKQNEPPSTQDAVSPSENSISRKQYRSLSHMIRAMMKFEGRDYRVRRDLTSYRANSVLTQMNSALRKFIFLKGDQKHRMKLYSIDLSNSQPFFLSVLLKLFQLFPSNIISNNTIDTSFGLVFLSHICFLEIQYAQYPSKTKILKTLKELGMLEESEDGAVRLRMPKIRTGRHGRNREQEIQMFFEACQEGRIYEKLMEFHNSEKCGKQLTRDEIKRLFIIYLFALNKTRSEVIKPLMMEHFPYIHALLKEVKKHDHAILPVLLQCLESHLFLDVVARRLRDETEIEFATLHDSIITTEENVVMVERIILEAFASEFGVRPNLKVTCWQEEAHTVELTASECVYTKDAEDEQSALGSSVEEAPAGTRIDSESVYVSGAIDEPSKLRSPVVESPASLSESTQKNISLETRKVMSALEEFHIDDEDLPQTKEELDQCVELLESEEKKARQSGDMEGAKRYDKMILVMKHARLTMKLKKFSSKVTKG